MTSDRSSPLPPLVSAEWLAARLGEADLRILDIRSGPEAETEFATAHVPGAVRADYATAGWRAQRGAAPGLLPEPQALAALLGRFGIGRRTRVVIVSAGELSTAARIHWTLKAAGHEAVAVLDGGFAAWTAMDGPVEAGPSRDVAGPDYPVAPDESLRARLPAVEAVVREGGAALLDARGAKDFSGETKSPHSARGGRLPGALAFDQSRFVDPQTKRLRPRAELDAMAADLPSGPAVTFCNTGQAAASSWFVLSEILGRPGVTLYDGSMSEWTSDPARPVETGPA